MPFQQGLLLALLVASLVLLGVYSTVRRALDDTYHVAWPLLGGLVVALIASRAGRVRLASAIAVLLAPAFVLVVLTTGPERSPVLLAYLPVGVVLAGVLLSWRGTAAMALVNVSVIAIAAAVNPAVAGSPLLAPLSLATVATATLVLVGIRARDRLEAERDAELLASNMRKGLMLETAMDAIITIDTTGTIVEVNAAAERMFGYPRQRMLGEEMAQLVIPAAQREAHRTGLARYVAAGVHGAQSRRLDLRARRADGCEFPCELTIAASHPPSGMLITGFLRDSSEREAAAQRHQVLEEQLRQSQKMQAIGQLAGGIAHEFNNMLQVITGFLSMAMEDLRVKAPETVPDLAQAADAADRASDLTRRLLAFSRRQVLQLEVVDFNEALSSTLALIRRVIGEQVELEFHPGEDLPSVELDRGQFQQVVLNLCLNARDAMPDGGRLILETELVEVPESFVADHPWASAGTYVALVVADSGLGMSPEVAARIFEPFFTTKEARGGTGLGLAVVHGIVEQHRGFIRVDTDPGEGTSFRVYWPISGEQVPARYTAESPTPVGGTETVLVAEDADAIRTLVERTLTAAGYRVIAVANGKDALRRFQEDSSRFDLVVLDLVMPKLGGRAALEAMRLARPDLRAIFLSGYSASEITEEWLHAMRAELLMKPVTSQTLLRRVRAVLDRR